MKKERILITVKTYPTISTTYNELVCTAGMREDGSWIRIYPVPFRKLYEKYEKFQWVEMETIKNRSDRRNESHRLLSPDSITLQEKMGTENNWQERKSYILEKGDVYEDLDELIQLNKSGKLSLATFKPTKIVDLVVEEVDREWDKEKIETLKQQAKQEDLFSDNAKYFSVVNKLPYKFSYKLLDRNKKPREMMIEDWEIGMLFWNCLKRHHGDEKKAILDVRRKYIDDFANNKDIHLFLGTTLQYDGWAKNPFIIIGVFAPPITRQAELF